MLAVSAKLRQPIGQRLCKVRTQQKKLMRPILFLYYEESLVSSNLNSKLLRFHSVRPNVQAGIEIIVSKILKCYSKNNLATFRWGAEGGYSMCPHNISEISQITIMIRYNKFVY